MKNYIKNTSFIIILLGLFFILFNSCSKDTPPPPPTINLPIVTTSAIFDITQSSAKSGGTVTSDGVAEVTERGICWSTSDNPTIIDSKNNEGKGTGTFSSAMSGLNKGTKYYVRAYATNVSGTAYGNSLSFTTNQPKIPVLTTAIINTITPTSAISGGNITSDGGNPITSRGVCWSTSQSPEITGNHTSDGTGTGNFTSSISGLLVNTSYYIRAYAINEVGIAYGDELNFKTANYFTIGSGVTDIESNSYKTIILGTQEWMSENLKTTKYNDGNSISHVTNNATWQNLNTGGYCWYNNDSILNKAVYGALYNWYSVNTNKLCPTGWHVPSETEWSTLLTYLGIAPGGKLKESDTVHWLKPNSGANNLSGFTGLPGGLRIFGPYYFIQKEGDWWTSATTPSGRGLIFNDASVSTLIANKSHGLSVRCVKD